MGIIVITALALVGLALRGKPATPGVAIEIIDAPGIDPGEAELPRCITPERARRISRRI